MNKPNIQIGNEIRQMTDAEYSEWLEHGKDIDARVEQIRIRNENHQLAKESALSKLTALGLTQEEINALLS